MRGRREVKIKENGARQMDEKCRHQTVSPAWKVYCTVCWFAEASLVEKRTVQVFGIVWLMNIST